MTAFVRPLLFALAAALLTPRTGDGLPARSPAPPPPAAFTNPIVRSRETADPWIIRRDGFYYFTFTAGGHIEIWKSPTITGLDSATRATVWRAPRTGPNSHDVWAPEIHFVRGKWYIYYTATDEKRTDANRRIYALEAATADPLGPYIDRGKVAPPTDDVYAIDGTIFEQRGALYFVWSGRAGPGGGPQNLYIAPMSNPWTISGRRVLLSTPRYGWERVGWHVNEGPEILQRGGKTFIVYSASGGTTPNYALGLLTNRDGSLLNSASWTKSPVPVFSQYAGPDGVVYAPGHNGFTGSPDGTEDWIVYHAKNEADGTWRGRTARAQRFVWNPDNTPNFGHPIPPGVRLAVPSGEPGSDRPIRGAGTGLLGKYFARPDFSGVMRARRDGRVNFDWRLDAPLPALGADHFSARWRGQVQPRYSDTYTFQTYADDGVQVWVDGKRIISNWNNRAAATDRGKIALTAGRKYDIRVDYYDFNDRARLSLFWSSPRQPFEVIPQSQLYPPPTPKRSARH